LGWDRGIVDIAGQKAELDPIVQFLDPNEIICEHTLMIDEIKPGPVANTPLFQRNARFLGELVRRISK